MLLDDIKTALRISNTAFDGEIQDLIDAVKLELELTGVNPAKIVDTDPLIKRAITVYVKANFGYDNPDAKRLQDSYTMLKMHLSLSSEYKVSES